MKKNILIFMAVTVICSCTENTPEELSYLVFDQELLVNHVEEDIKTDTAYIKGDQLYVKVIYSGCDATNATLISAENFKESYPVQLDMKIKLGDPGLCEKIIHDEFTFELTAIKERYLKQYQEKSGTILLDIKNWNSLVEYIF